MNLLEVMTGCETENRYQVFAADSAGERKVGPVIFSCKEHSSWCSRNCLAGNCRPFDMTINHSNLYDPHQEKPFLLLHRECRCTCLCLNRPSVDVQLVENGANENIGSVRAPFSCCDLLLEIWDKNDNHKYSVKGSCC